MADKLSTSALAKKRQQDAKQLFQDLKTAGYIHRHDEQWILTDLGTKFGESMPSTLSMGVLLSGLRIC